MESPPVAHALLNAQLLRPRQPLHEFALEQVQAADTPQQAERMAKLNIVALQGVRCDRQVLPAGQGTGLEAWRLLRERLRPQTSGGTITELQ
eukprot:12206258-Alexandrium_andersonii.AAC.1